MKSVAVIDDSEFEIWPQGKVYYTIKNEFNGFFCQILI
jgi:hypothetical protein